MSVEVQAPSGKTLIVGVHNEDQDVRLASKDPIQCTLQGWSEKDVLEARSWSHVMIKRHRYKIISPLNNNTLTIQLEGSSVLYSNFISVSCLPLVVPHSAPCPTSQPRPVWFTFLPRVIFLKVVMAKQRAPRSSRVSAMSR
jgi:hypothetical protein